MHIVCKLFNLCICHPQKETCFEEGNEQQWHTNADKLTDVS